MTSPWGKISGVDFGDALLSAAVREDMARISALLAIELSVGDETLADAARHLFNSVGTPVRALFTVLSANLGPDPHCWKVKAAAAVTELLHMAALHHRDVYDVARPCRRPTNPESRWNNTIAILAGDYLLATASRLTSRLGADAVRVIAETFAQLVTGQLRQARGASTDVNPVEHYRRVVSERAGSLWATSGRFGATFSGAPGDQIERLSHLGGTLGMVVQISEDLLAVQSWKASMGIALPDIGQSQPVLQAIRDAKPDADRPRKVSSADPGVATNLEAIAALEATAGLSKAHELRARYATQARQEMEDFPQGPGRAALVTFLDHTLDRHR